MCVDNIKKNAREKPVSYIRQIDSRPTVSEEALQNFSIVYLTGGLDDLSAFSNWIILQITELTACTVSFCLIMYLETL